MFCHDCSYKIRFIFKNTKPDIFRIPKNQRITNTPSKSSNFQLKLFTREGRKQVSSSIVDSYLKLKKDLKSQDEGHETWEKRCHIVGLHAHLVF